MEKRHFTRVIFSTQATLMQGKNSWATQLIDLSFKGALIEHPLDLEINDGEYQLIFRLSGSDVDISMTVRVIHNEQHHIGLSCEQMDIDSMTHLRRLIELNVGDDSELNRELDALSHPDS